VVWKTALPGRGWSSPVVDGRQIWMTAAHETPAKPEDVKRRLAANTADQPLVLLDQVDLHAVCVDRDSGRILHDLRLFTEREPQWSHQLNSYASPSPIIENGRLYTHFGSLGTACLDTESLQVLWTNRELQVMHENGPGSSPVLWQDRLIVHFDGSDAQFIAAFDKTTGKVAWKTARSGEMDPRPQQRKAYGTPLIVEMNGAPVVVSPAANWVYGYEPASGRELWKVAYDGLGFSMPVRPVADTERFYVGTSYGKSQVVAVKYAGVKTPEVAWRNPKNAPKMASPVLANGLLFYVDDGGILSCVEPATGEVHYRERLGGKFSASPIVANGKLYFCSREGVVSVVPAEKTFRIDAQNTLDGTLMASPVALDGALYLRTEAALYRIGGSR